MYTIKSGPGGYNSSIEAKARLDLGHAEQRLRQDRVTTHKKMAYAYGRRKTNFKDGIEKLASKDFWHELSGDEEFYLNRDCPDQTDSSNHVTLWDGSNYKRAA